MTRLAVAAALLAATLSGCGAAPSPLAARGPMGAMTAAGKADGAAAFVKAIEAKYAAALNPGKGGSITATGLETYKVDRRTRVRATLVVHGEGFEARLDAMAGTTKDGEPVADYFPGFESATFASGEAAMKAAAAYAARIQRLSTAQYKTKADLAGQIDPKKYQIEVHPRAAGDKMLAEVTYESEGFMGKGSTFTEAYYVYGTRGGKGTIKDVTYGWNKATDQHGNDLDQ